VTCPYIFLLGVSELMKTVLWEKVPIQCTIVFCFALVNSTVTRVCTVRCKINTSAKLSLNLTQWHGRSLFSLVETFSLFWWNGKFISLLIPLFYRYYVEKNIWEYLGYVMFIYTNIFYYCFNSVNSWKFFIMHGYLCYANKQHWRETDFKAIVETCFWKW
jgi:hypothetical protein